MNEKLKIVFLGLSITSSWGNGHATTYRALIRELGARGHEILFLERDVPWYAENRDLKQPPGATVRLYGSVNELKDRFATEIRTADVVIVGSYVPDGVEVGRWVTATAEGLKAFYDIDTPVTLKKLQTGDYEYLTPELIAHYDLYLSFTGGPTLRYIEERYRVAAARPLYCSVSPQTHYPEAITPHWDIGYLGTYAADRQPMLEELLIDPAERWPHARFVVAGPLYPDHIRWPGNVERIDHLPPDEHRRFYCRQRFTVNLTRQDMVRAGYSPSVRLFEAAACGTPIISDYWPGLETFFRPNEEILIAKSSGSVLNHLTMLSEEQRRAIGERARERVMREHTAAHRAVELENHIWDSRNQLQRFRLTRRINARRPLQTRRPQPLHSGG